MPSFKSLRYFRRPTVRTSAHASALALGTVPTSGTASAENSQAALAAAVELATSLDVMLNDIDFEGIPSDQLQLQLDRLSLEAAKYSNYGLGIGVGDKWSCSFEDAQMIAAACSCSLAAYSPEIVPKAAGLRFSATGSVEPSRDGTVKAMRVWKVDSGVPDINHNQPDSFVVISVRGTASSVDCMVNLNGKPKDASKFLLHETKGALGDSESLSAHRGFLLNAEALAPEITRQLDEILRDHPTLRKVIFTGHSAGGAVAGLLYTHFLYRAADRYGSTKFSLITFGAPPVLSMNISDKLEHPNLSHNRGLILAIVNEHDMVSRVDGTYMRSLVDLYRSIHGLPPILNISKEEINESFTATEDTKVESSIESRARLEADLNKDFPLPTLSTASTTSSFSSSHTNSEWLTPKADYLTIGKVVLLQVSLCRTENLIADGDTEVGATTKDETPKTSLAAFIFSPEQLSKMLFCSIAVHKRVIYTQRIDLLLQGKFNGKASWA